MADITLTFAAGALTPSVSAVGRAASISVDLSGYAAYINNYAVGQTGNMTVTQFDAVGRQLSRAGVSNFTSGFNVTVAAGCAALEFEFSCARANGIGPAPIKSFPVAITAPAEVPAFDADDEGKVLTVVVDDEVASLEWATASDGGSGGEVV